MLEMVRGKVLVKRPQQVLVEVQGLGFAINIPADAVASLPPVGEEVTLYTHLVIREEEIVLYGFPLPEQLAAFRQLLKVSGVGPKSALALLGVMTPAELRAAVERGNANFLSRVPGIGPKTARRIIVELQGRCDWQSKDMETQSTAGAAGEAVAALKSLGYTREEAWEAVRRAQEVIGGPQRKEAGIEELLRAALRLLSPSI